MLHRRTAIRADERGSTVVEFALVSPMVIILILSALQLGLALRANAGLRELIGWAGREAVVSYQVFGDDDTISEDDLKAKIEAEAAKAAYNLKNGTLAVVVESDQDTTLLTVNRIRIRMDYDYPLDLPFIPTQTIDLGVERTFFVPNASPV